MRFLPRRRTRDAASAPGRRRIRWGRTVLTAIGVGLLGFLLGCYLFAPTGALKDRLEYEVARVSPIQVDIEELALRFPPGLTVSGVTLNAPQLPQPLEIASASVSPRWLSLFGGPPGADLAARLLGGEIDAALFRDGSFHAEGRDLSLEIPLSATSALRLSGTLRRAEVSGTAPLQPKTESHAELVIENLVLGGLQAIGAGRDTLPLGTLTLTVSGQGNSFRLEDLRAEGGEMAVSGGGSLLLTQPLTRSRLNLNLSLQPGDSFDPALRDLLGLVAKPARDGSLRLRLSGSLASPNLQ